MNKREFVVGSCAAVAGVAASARAVGAGVAEQAARAPGLRRQRLPDLATDVRGAAWQHYLGHEFAAAGGVRLTLQNVQRHAGDRVLEQFTLRFDAGPASALTGGTQVLVHGTGQRVSLYLDPAGSAAGGARAYHAHFCLMA